MELRQTSSPTKRLQIIKHEYLTNYHENMPQTCVFCNILTIFRRISHLLGEELARIILCDDKTSRSGSSMLIYSRYLPGVSREFQQAWSLKYDGGKNCTSAQSTHGWSNDSQARGLTSFTW